MSTPPGSTPPPGPPPPDRELTEEELRAAYEAELKRIRVEDVLVQAVVSLLNLGARKAGLAGAAPGSEGEDDRDFEQVRQAIEGVRALLPLVEPALGPDAKAVRDALSQLQLAYARSGAGGAAPSTGRPPPGADQPGAGGRAPSSGRLWVPGQ